VSLRSIYLSFPQFGSYPNEWIAAVRRLQAEDGVRIVRVDGCLRAEPRTALLRLRLQLDSAWAMSSVVLWAHSEGLQLIDPRTLTPGHKAYFYETYLPQFRLVVRQFVSPDAALLALKRALQHPVGDIPPPPRLAEPAPRRSERAPRLARGTETRNRVSIEWRVPRVQVFDNRGNRDRTASGVIDANTAVTRAGEIQ
jgi:hypothetical protein